MPKVVITDFINDDLAVERTRLKGLADVVAYDAFQESELAGKIEDADCIMMFHNLSISRSTIERLTHCRLIVRCGVGFDNVDHAFAAQRGIPVANVPDYGTEEVADSAIGMMLALTRGIHPYNVHLRHHPHPWMYTIASPLVRLRGQTMGLVGLGRIGMATALRAKALGMRVIFYDPGREDGYEKSLGIIRCDSLDDLLQQSLVVSLHCPMSPENHHLIDGKRLERMPKGSYLINTARGKLVDTKAIPAALASGRLAGAAIDVLEQEPPEPDHPLLVAWRDPKHAAYNRLIINPHAAFYSEEGLLDMRVKGVEACRRALLGEPLRNVINGVVPKS